MKEEKTHLGVPGGGVFASSGQYTDPQQVEGTHKIDRWLTRLLLKAIGGPRIEVALWSGETVCTCDKPIARVKIRDRATLHALMYQPNITFGDAFSNGRIEVVGDLLAFLEEAYLGQIRARAKIAKFLPTFTRTRGNTHDRARENIYHHYDLGNDFYRLWLDDNMVYTCAYFESAQMSLAEAQVAKLDHVCRKLQLEPGQSVIEAGCGWGALALHMAEHYGVNVKAYNISKEQLAYARQMAKAKRLENNVEFIEDDYRNINSSCDAFVSVGMLEHVGIEQYKELGNVIQQCLKPTGRGLIHSIGRSSPAPNNKWIEKRIFPGSYPPSLSEVSRIFEPFDFSILDIENLRLHYRETCRLWLENFDSVADQVAQMYDDNFVRAWRLYLAGSTTAFQVGTLQLFQIVFTPFGNNKVPWTRHHLYQQSLRHD